MRRRIVAAGLLVLLAGGTVGGEEASGESWPEIRQETFEKLHALANWCRRAQLYACRAEVYEAVLQVDPDDEDARRWLRYERGPDGAWVKDPNANPPRNLRRGKKKYEAKRTELAHWFEDAVRPFVERGRTVEAIRRRGEVTQVALAVDPGNETFRAWNGEVADGEGGWILEESKGAKERRVAVLRTARRLVDEVPEARLGEPVAIDRLGGIDWKYVLEGPRVRLLGRADLRELRLIHRYAEAAFPYFRAVFDTSGEAASHSSASAPMVTVYVFAERFGLRAFFEAQPDMTRRDVERALSMAGWWLRDRPATAVMDSEMEARLECAPRQMLSSLIWRKFAIPDRHDWAYEGLIVYLTDRLVGTRLLFSVQDVKAGYTDPPPGAPDYVTRLQDPGADWLLLGRGLFRGPEKPDLFLLPGKTVNDLTKLDVLYAYCLAAYLIEGHPDKAAAFYDALGGVHDRDLDAICLKTLGCDGHALDARVTRWLAETVE